MTRILVVALAVALSACTDDEPVVIPPPTSTAITLPPRPRPEPRPGAPGVVTVAVLSDLHTPNDGEVSAPLERLVAALLELRPTAVVITGDFTNGDVTDGLWRQRRATMWYAAVRTALAPLTRAGIPVFPVAGNHDSYLDGQRRAYAMAWRDLDHLAAPYEIHSAPLAAGEAYRIDAAPFTYSVDLGGVHLAFGHLVDQHLRPDVGHWLAADLDAAAGARARLVFGHVPAVSVMGDPAPLFEREMFGLLAGRADAYVAGHEHLVWDETFRQGAARLHQISVGCATGAYVFPPSPRARSRAACGGRWPYLRCAMPETGDRFSLRPHPRGLIERHRQTFTLVEVAADGQIRAHPYAIDPRGRLVDWAEPTVPPVVAAAAAAAAR